MSETIAEKLKRPVIVDREIPDVGGVRVRRMTAANMLELSNRPAGRETSAWLLKISVVDEHGRPVYASDEEVWATDNQTLEALTKFVMEVNRLIAKDAESNSDASLAATPGEVNKLP